MINYTPLTMKDSTLSVLTDESRFILILQKLSPLMMRMSYLSWAEIFNRKCGKTLTVLLLNLDFKKKTCGFLFKFDQAIGIKEFVEIFDSLVKLQEV